MPVRNDFNSRSAVPADGDQIAMVSYWPDGDFRDGRGIHIRHIRVEHEAYIAKAMADQPSGCVWIVPGFGQ